MMGDDGAGPLLAELLRNNPASGWHVIDGGSSPENVAHEVSALHPQRVVVVDAAEMGLAAGEIRRVDDHCIADMFMMTTHNLPLSFLIERLRETIAEVLFLGIQPETVAFYFPMSSAVGEAVATVHSDLRAGRGVDHYPWLTAEA